MGNKDFDMTPEEHLQAGHVQVDVDAMTIDGIYYPATKIWCIDGHYYGEPIKTTLKDFYEACDKILNPQ